MSIDATEGSKTATTTTDKNDDLTSFVTSPVPVYIEDTDAYGVIYNANYIRAYDRALHRTSILSSSSSGSTSSLSSSTSVITQHDGWSIASIENMKFKSSPPLGGEYVIRGTLKPSNSNINSSSGGMEEIWDMEMTDIDGSVVYNTATGVHIAHPPMTSHLLLQQPLFEDKTSSRSWLPQPQPFQIPSTSSSCIYSFPTFRDEYDTHLSTHLPLFSLLKLFERCRSNMLGGPNELEKLQNEHGLLFVVTSVKDGSLVCYEDIMKYNTVVMTPGVEVFVKTDVVVKRKGMIIDCYHTAFLKIQSDEKGKDAAEEEGRGKVENGVIIGQAIISLMSIDGTSRRPTSKLPQFLLDRLQGVA